MPVEEIVFDFIEECEITLIKVDSDIDVEEDMSSAGLSQNYILMKPWSFCLSSRYMKDRVSKIHERALRLVKNTFLATIYVLFLKRGIKLMYPEGSKAFKKPKHLLQD